MRPTPIYVISTFLPIVSALLSITGASAILYNLLSDHQRRFTSPYFRIMFGLSLTDGIFGFFAVISPFLAPKGTAGLFYAKGNQASCEAVGFLRHFTALIQPLYIASLSSYYLLVIKYDVSDDLFKKKVEPWIHVVSIGYPLLGSIVAESLGMFNATPVGCSMSAYPFGCDNRDKKTCTRGANAFIYKCIFSNSIIILSFFVTTVCMLSIVLHVRKRERIMNRRFSFNNSEISRSRSLVKQYNAVMVQAFLYIGSFFVIWTVPGIYSIGKIRPVFLAVVAMTMLPLQGFFNSIIYFWPRYVKTKEEHGDKSFCWRLKDMIFTSTLAKEQRRVVRHAVRRRSSLFNTVGSPPSSPALHVCRTSEVNLEESLQRPIPFQNPTSTPFDSNSPMENTADSEGHVNDHVSSQISSIYYEPLVRFREMRAEMNRSLDKIDDDGHCRSIESGSVKAAALAVQNTCEYDDDSTSSKSQEIRKD